MAFTSQWLDELLSKSEISEIISSYIELKPKGRKLWGLCPFHGEKTPSFSVSPEKQLFYCFGCHVGGSVVQFVMLVEKLTYREAIIFLAERAHMSLPDQVSDAEYLKQKAYKDRILQLNQISARFFCESLIGSQGQNAREYAYKRGLTKDIILRFGIGYAPDSWEALKQHLLEQGYSEKEMVDAGVLVHNTERKSTYDVYRNRLIFPIQNVTGSVIGFGGRVLDDSKPKYINTGDTPVYNKKNNLYGLNLLKQEKLNDIVIVEGYMDVVGLYKAGIRNAVASLGTALTVQQARLLKRYSGEIYIAYDGDFAGQNGMIRGLEILAEQGLNVHIIVFPENLDPDEFVQKYGKDSFYDLKSKAYTISRFKLERMADGIDFSLEDKREEYAINACKYISTLQPLVRERYISVVAEKTGYSSQVLIKQISSPETKTIQQNNVYINNKSYKTLESPSSERDQIMILRACIQDTSLCTLVEALPVEIVFTDIDLRRVYLFIRDGGTGISSFISSCEPEVAQRITEVLQTEFTYNDPSRIISDCLNNIQSSNIDNEITVLQAQIAGHPANENELILKITELQKQKRGIIKNGKAGR